MQVPVPTDFDVLEASQTYLISAAFAKTNSPAYRVAVAAAKQASRYGERVEGKSIIHTAAFADTPKDVQLAATVLRCISGWKTALVCVEGRLIRSTWESQFVVACYWESNLSRDWRAHCLVPLNPAPAPTLLPDSRNADEARTIRTEFQTAGQTGVFPCKYLLPYMSDALHRPQLAPMTNVIQARAVSFGCDWCPRFNPDLFESAST